MLQSSPFLVDQSITCVFHKSSFFTQYLLMFFFFFFLTEENPTGLASSGISRDFFINIQTALDISTSFLISFIFQTASVFILTDLSFHLLFCEILMARCWARKMRSNIRSNGFYCCGFLRRMRNAELANQNVQSI